jgi:cathepsin X
VTNYTLYYVKEYGHLSGTDEIKREIYIRGPITCRLHATERFYRYVGGVYSEDLREIELNHEVSIVGWGKIGEVEYWIGRNSWGTYWGEEGFFKINMYNDNLGIEKDCTWGIPSFQKP